MTILHAEFHRPKHLPVRDRFARHYSDFSVLWQQDAARSAGLARLDLLADVASHKSRYFAFAWTNYGSAKIGILRLVSPSYRCTALARDYAAMRPMSMTEPPAFAELMQKLALAEVVLNNL